MFLFKDKLMICLNDLYVFVEGIIHFSFIVQFILL